MMLVTEPLSSGECARYNDIETKLVKVLGSAERLNWMAVSTRPEVSFVDPLNRNVGGYTDCFAHEMVVGVGSTVFAHETVHALQNCNARQPAEDGWDFDHANWQKDGLFQLIDEVSQ